MTERPEAFGNAVPYVLAEQEIDDHEAIAVIDEAVVADADVSVIEVTGPGAVMCIQGLLTNDVERAGTGGFVYGAMLTAKGMIISDMWVTRTNGTLWLTPPSQGAGALSDVFVKFLPPRLARPTIRTDTLSVLRLVGPTALETAHRAGINVPEPGRSSIAIAAEAECVVSRPEETSFFALQLQVAQTHAGRLRTKLEDAGARASNGAALELARIISGWPRLGAEIDGKTLPHEVRYDELNGVSYTKGCYTGQETVARLHFRGHANRELHALVWEGEPDPSDDAIFQAEKRVGRVTSLAWLAPIERYVGLGIIHRKADPSEPLIAGGTPAGVTALPLRFDR